MGFDMALFFFTDEGSLGMDEVDQLRIGDVRAGAFGFGAQSGQYVVVNLAVLAECRKYKRIA